MTPAYEVETVPQFDRLYRRLLRQQPQLPRIYAGVIEILEDDPYNASGQHRIRKLTNKNQGQ